MANHFDKQFKLTPAGAQFVGTLRSLYGQLKAAIEQGQNFSAKYAESIRLSLPIRSAISISCPRS